MAERVAVIGKGGREQAVAYKIAQSCYVGEVLVLPGNPGSEFLSQRLNKPVTNIALKNDSVDDVLEIIGKSGVSLVVVGPESWLARGIGNALEESEVAFIAPSREAGRLEFSKVFTRENCRRWGVLQPEFNVFENTENAVEYVNKCNLIEGVVKADGLADGKGAIVCDTEEELKEAIFNIREKFPAASKTFLIEERLHGTEISYIAVTDGERFRAFPTARDYKREYDGDRGENTGSMGTVVPNEVVTDDIAKKIEETMLKPILKGMRDGGNIYKGIIYLGVMLTDSGPKLIEINARGGDTETQTQLPVMNVDLYELFLHAANSDLNNLENPKNKVCEFCTTVVLAASDYPRATSKGIEIYGLGKNIYDPSTIIFQAGTKRDGRKIVTNGGRILNVVGVGDTLEIAIEKAYKVIDSGVVYFEGMKYRRDIGKVNV